MEDGYTTGLKGVSLFFVHESADIVLGWAMPNRQEALVTARRFASTVPFGEQETRWESRFEGDQMEGDLPKIKI